MTLPKIGITLALLLLVSGAALAEAEPRYSITFIRSLGGAGCDGYGINAQGQVAGFAFTAGTTSTPSRAFLYSNGVTQNLGLLSGGVDSYGKGINARGDVVGYASISEASQYHAFLYSSGVMKDLGTLGGASSFAYDVNDLGEVVGFSAIGNVNHAFVYSGNTITDLGPKISALYSSSAAAINNSGQIAGSFGTATGIRRAFIYQNDHMIDFSPTPSADCVGSGINENGQAIGYHWSGAGAFLYSGGSTVPIPLSEAHGINSVGQIVGSTWVGRGPTKHAFIYQNGKAEDLNDLVAQKPKWILYEAEAINDAGQIVGRGNSGEAGYGTFLLTPIPSSTSGIEVNKKTPKKTTKASIIVKGEASGVVIKVLYRVGTKGAYKAAKGTNSWQFRAKLSMGRNRIAIVIQRSGGKSKPKSFFIVRHKK